MVCTFQFGKQTIVPEFSELKLVSKKSKRMNILENFKFAKHTLGMFLKIREYSQKVNQFFECQCADSSVMSG